MNKILFVLSLSISLNCYSGDITCLAVANNVAGFADQETTVTGFGNYSIINSTNKNQIYLVEENICIHGYGCNNFSYHVYQEPHTSITIKDVIYVKAIMKKGVYIDTAMIKIKGKSDCISEAKNTVWIN